MLFRSGTVRRFAALALLLLAAGHWPAGFADPPAAGDAPVEIQFIAFNDLHGHIAAPGGDVRLDSPGGVRIVPAGGAAYLASFVADLKEEYPFSVVVGAGDMIGASPLVSGLFHDEPTIEALNAIGLEYSAVGNHEFDDGRAELLRMQRGGCMARREPGRDTCILGPFRGASFAYLAANVIDTSTGRPFLPPYAVETFPLGNGVSVEIALIGIVLHDTPDLVSASASEGLRFEDEAATVNSLVPTLREQGIDAVVLLIHQGGEAIGEFDGCEGIHGPIVDIVRRLDSRITAVVSGHTHRAYVCRLPSRDLHRSILTTQAGDNGRFVTQIVLSVPPRGGEATVVSARNLPVLGAAAGAPGGYRSVRPVAEIAGAVARYEVAAAPLARREVGRVRAPLVRAAGATGESLLGDVVADAQLAAMAVDERGRAEIAFMNPGGLREDLLPGERGIVTYGDLFAVQPFGNHLVTLELSGAQIERLLEQQWREDGHRIILQVSEGFEYAWRPGPPGQHIVVGTIRLHGNAVDPEARYRVAVNDFLAGGGNGFSVLMQGRVMRVDGVDVDAFAAYVRAHSPLGPPASGRIHKLP